MAKGKSNTSQHLKTDIDYDKLAEAIVKAHKKIRTIEEKEFIKQKQKDQEEWYNIIGYKEYPENEKWIVKKYHKLKNNIAILKSVITFKSKNAQKPRLTFELMRLGTSSVYEICEFILYLVAIYFLISPFIFDNSEYSVIIIALPAYIFARLIRIAKLEIANLNDKDVLNTLFSANMTFAGVILALIAIIVEII